MSERDRSAMGRKTLYYVGWLRVMVISLVVAHHAGQAYGPTGGEWPVFEPERTALLGPFFSVNAGFFMGLFFLISGYFVPGSLARKGTARFIIDRLVRLGIPLVVIGFGVFAVIGYALGADSPGFWAYYRDTYIGSWEVEYGPLWFVFHLLVYSVVYAVLALALPALTAFGRRPPPDNRMIAGLVIALAVVTGSVRVGYEQDDWINIFGLIPSEPVHLPQYIIFFGVGTLAGRNDWFETLPGKKLATISHYRGVRSHDDVRFGKVARGCAPLLPFEEVTLLAMTSRRRA